MNVSTRYINCTQYFSEMLHYSDTLYDLRANHSVKVATIWFGLRKPRFSYPCLTQYIIIHLPIRRPWKNKNIFARAWQHLRLKCNEFSYACGKIGPQTSDVTTAAASSWHSGCGGNDLSKSIYYVIDLFD